MDFPRPRVPTKFRTNMGMGSLSLSGCEESGLGVVYPIFRIGDFPKTSVVIFCHQHHSTSTRVLGVPTIYSLSSSISYTDLTSDTCTDSSSRHY